MKLYQPLLNSDRLVEDRLSRDSLEDAQIHIYLILLCHKEDGYHIHPPHPHHTLDHTVARNSETNQS